VAHVTNADLAELLADSAEAETGIRQRALKRAARSAFLWPEEAADLLQSGRALTELHGVGPFIAQILQQRIENPAAGGQPSDPLRQDFLTLASARAILARDSTWQTRVRGDLHMHSTWSDGSGTIAEMAAAGRQLGYEYIAITDHSKGLKIASGIDEAAIAEQSIEVAQTNAIQAGPEKCEVLHSLELNLNPRGAGDMGLECLARLDLVLGSFHSALRFKDDQTARYLAALQNPAVHILGHPRGRIYNYRAGLSADWPRVFAEAARLDKAVEIDCFPDRQDLNVELLKLAREAGTRVSLGTDAHHTWQLAFIEFGLAAALEAELTAERIVNFLSLAEIKQWIGDLRIETS
jgi:histidinol phosphatase-like PHP family hydrolase